MNPAETDGELDIRLTIKERKRREAVKKLFRALNEGHRAAGQSIKTSKSSGAYNNGSINFQDTVAIPTTGGLFQQLPVIAVHWIFKLMHYQYLPQFGHI
jgi:hypothetical protein